LRLRRDGESRLTRQQVEAEECRAKARLFLEN